jgi:elongation factor Ts
MSTATVIDAQLVKTLREKTNAGLMDCKRALAEAGGDLEAAVDLLRKKGAASAAKKADREAKDGTIAQAILPGAKIGVIMEVNCETDFVAKNDSFKAFCEEIARRVARIPARISSRSHRSRAEDRRERPHSSPRALEVKDSGLVAATFTPAAKSGVLVEVGAEKETTAQNEEFKQLVRDITLQIAAANPICVDRTQISPDILQRERAIYAEQVQGKPPISSRRSSMVRWRNTSAPHASWTRRSSKSLTRRSRSLSPRRARNWARIS